MDLAELTRGVLSVVAVPEGKTLAVSIPDSPLRARGVPVRLEAALRNLIDNAVSFARTEIAVSVRKDGDDLVVEVHDDGPGIPREDIGRVFERFFSARAEGRGTGLGLAIVHATLTAHGGDVLVRSEPARGTSFEIRLPAAPP